MHKRKEKIISRLSNFFGGVCVCCVSHAQSCPTLCYSLDYSLPGSSVRGIFQARILEWVAISFCRRCSWSRDWTQVSHIVDTCFTVWATREVKCISRLYNSINVCIYACTLSRVQLFLTPLVDYTAPGSSVHGISQARILEWVAISFCRRSSWPRDRTWVSCISRRVLHTEPPRKHAQNRYMCVCVCVINNWAI